MSSRLSRSIAAGAAWTAAPAVLARACVDSNWRGSLAERFGGGAWRAVASPEPSVWIHAASVGEVGGLAPFLEALKGARPDLRQVISTTSLTGRERARALPQAASAALLPLDHPYVVRRVLNELNPQAVIISETELWPNLLFSLERREIPTVLINARISDYSFPRYQRLRSLLRPALSVFSAVLAQSERDAERFRALGLPAERVQVAGSTKYDREVPRFSEEERAAFARELGIDPGRPCLVAGSVRPGEDREVLKAFYALQCRLPDLQLIIAPRHPERFESTAALLTEMNIPFNRRSAGAVSVPQSVMLLDSMGELQRCYALASYSFIGASLVDIGGHNPLEPAAYGSPIIAGPYMSTVRDAVEALKRAGGMVEVADAEELAAAVQAFAVDESRRLAAGESAKRVWRQNVGAAERTLAHVLPHLPAAAAISPEERDPGADRTSAAGTVS